MLIVRSERDHVARSLESGVTSFESHRRSAKERLGVTIIDYLNAELSVVGKPMAP